MKKMTKGTLYKVTATLAFLFITVGCQPPGPSSYTVSGTINVSNNTFTDSDVNDIYATDYNTSNNTFATAQAISKPAVVGGFVKGAYGGATGQLSSDTVDYYKVSLLTGETVNLYIADLSPDLDLYLYATSDTVTPVDSSATYIQLETVTAPSTGDYYVKVIAYTDFDASNYTLTAGAVTITAANEYVRQTDFAPGEVLVRFKDAALPTGVQSAAVQAGLVGMELKSGAPGRVMLLGLGDASRQQQAAKVLGFQPTEAVGKYANATARLKRDTMKAVQALRERPDVLTADLNYHQHALAEPTDANYGSQWDAPMIDLPLAWEDTVRGNNVVVAVIDTGVLINHPDLNSQISADGGYDFISSTAISNDGDGIDSNPDDPGDKVPPETRSSFHGTHVAGTIAAETCLPSDCTNGTAGIAGIAPHAKIMPLRVLGQGGGYDSDIIQAMYYAANLSNNSGTTPTARGGQRADIINMSLGGGGYSSTFQSAVNQVRAAGVIIIAAAGNESTSTPSYPAAYDGVVSVSAVGPTQSLAYYSNYGSTIDVAAPGGDQSTGNANGILSTLGDDSSGSIVNTYGFYQGTSMACPHMAGVAALMVGYAKAHSVSLTPAEFDTKLANGELTDDIGTAGKDNSFGYGLINANKALVSAGLVLDIPPVMVVDKNTADLGGIDTSTTITVSNGSQGASAGDVTGVTVTPDGSSWLGVSTGSLGTITTATPATFNITVNRTGLADGYYTGTVTLSSSNASDVVIQVVMYQGTIAGDAGYQYITLVDATTQSQVEQIPTSRDPVTGSYSFSFANVPDGDYFIVSGSDMDNDFYICDEGEACGAYPDVGAFTVSGANVTGILFSSGYYVPSGTASLSTNTAARQTRQSKSASGKQVQGQ